MAALKGLAVLTPERLARLADRLVVRSFARGSVIYGEAPGNENICILISGVAKLTGLNRGRKRTLVELIGPGEVIAMTPLVPPTHDEVRCEAFVDCIAGLIPAVELIETVVGASYQDFALSVQLVVGRWWRLLTRDATFLDQSLERRVALTLLDLAIKIGTPREHGILLDAPLTHRDIAEMVGASRPKVTDELADLAARGLIGREGRRIAIAADKLEAWLNRTLPPAKVPADPDQRAARI